MTLRKAPPQVIMSFSAGVVPIYRAPGEPDLFLVLRCYNYWDFPKGGVLAGETPLCAALRELKEETTVEEIEFVWGEVFTETPIYARSKVARYYLARVLNLDVAMPINPLLGRAEHHEFRWLTYEDSRHLLNPRVQVVLDWARKVSQSAFVFTGGPAVGQPLTVT